jgi:hypothetical protein
VNRHRLNLDKLAGKQLDRCSRREEYTSNNADAKHRYGGASDVKGQKKKQNGGGVDYAEEKFQGATKLEWVRRSHDGAGDRVAVVATDWQP